MLCPERIIRPLTAPACVRLTVMLIIAISVLITAPWIDLSWAAASADRFNALYVPPHKITQRTFDEIVHYAALTPVNAVVLHVKTPTGKLMWPSTNPIARQLAVCAKHDSLKRHVARLKKDGIHTIAKLDVFADHRLAANIPELSVVDASTGLPWADANGLHWSNPSDRRVWEYNIALAIELAHLGFDEIQFDYIRFPSDGELSCIRYPNTIAGFSKSDCIQSFLSLAHERLKPLEIIISADVFGLTAWKANDFGVGQVLEKMAPYLDVICPMFYPSHFPTGFLGKQSPGEFPQMIMETSMQSMQKRTDKPIRPWIQGFWYRPDQIAAQLDGIANTTGGSWSIWNPTGRYELSYRAVAERAGVKLTRPQFYQPVAALAEESDRLVRGDSRVVNYTNFKMGYSILSLEASQNGRQSRYSSPSSIVETLEEGIVDHILASRSVRFNRNAEPYAKRKLLSDLLLADLGKDARRMRPEPIYIDWLANCRFSTQGIPKARLDKYARANQRLSEKARDFAETAEIINVASISENIFGISMNPAVTFPVTSIAQ